MGKQIDLCILPRPSYRCALYVLLLNNLKTSPQLTFLADFFKLITYMVFFAIICNFYGLPLHIIRDVYVTFRSFIQKCRDLYRYRRATRNMNELYPDATEEDLQRMSDSTCIICREDMHIIRSAEADSQAA